jgi:hypothetical protein
LAVKQFLQPVAERRRQAKLLPVLRQLQFDRNVVGHDDFFN